MVELFKHKLKKYTLYIRYSDEMVVKDAQTVALFYENRTYEPNSLTIFVGFVKDTFLTEFEFVSEIAKVGQKISPFVSKRIIFGVTGVQTSFLKYYQSLRDDSTANDILLSNEKECQEAYKINFSEDFEKVMDTNDLP